MSENMNKLDAVLQPILIHADKLTRSRKRLDQTKAETIIQLCVDIRHEFVLLENACIRMGVIESLRIEPMLTHEKGRIRI